MHDRLCFTVSCMIECVSVWGDQLLLFNQNVEGHVVVQVFRVCCGKKLWIVFVLLT